MFKYTKNINRQEHGFYIAKYCKHYVDDNLIISSPNIAHLEPGVLSI